MKAKMKKFTSLLLVLMMIVSLCPLTVLAAEDGSAAPETGAAEEMEAPAESPAGETPAPETEEETTPEAAPAADGNSGLVVGPAYEPVALPIALDGDAAAQVTVNYYDNAGTLISSESATSGGAPKAAVGPYVTVGGAQKIVLGFWSAKAMTLADLPTDGKLIMPMFKAVTANTDYYAVYAPESQSAAYIAYYLSLDSGQFSPIHWGSVAVAGEGSKPEAGDVPDYMAYQVKDSSGNYYNLYLSIAWYNNADLSGAAVNPSEIAVSGNTVYYGKINQSFYSVSFKDASGNLLALFPIESGKTIDAYPGATVMPSGDYWQDADGKVYTAAEIRDLAITKSLTLTPFAGYTVSYYDAVNETLLGTEKVLPGGTLKNIPIYEDKTVQFNLGTELDNSIPYYWYSTEEEAQALTFNDVLGTPLDMSRQAIHADVSFYAALDGGSIQFVSSFNSNGDISPLPVYAGQKIDALPEAREGFSTARWVDENGKAVDVLKYVSDGTGMKLYAVDGIKVSYYYGDTKIAGELVPSGQKPLLVPENRLISGSGSEPYQLIPINQWMDKDGNIVDPANTTITAETSFYAVIECAVTYVDSDGTTVLGKEYVISGGSPSQVPGKNGSNKVITNWLNASGSFVVLESLKITADTTLTAWYSPGLVDDEHGAYISGYGSGIFSPNSDLSRAEAAKIIYSLIENPTAGPFSASFSDMSSHWANEAVSFLASHKIITGYSNGTFLPNLGITRAEFVTILCRLFPMEAGSCNFTDVPESIWYYNAVASAVEKGWVTGYLESDGTYTFRPNNVITRAEAVTIMNRVLGRAADKAAFDATERMIFRDVAPSHWAFYQVMEASIAHDYTAGSTGEVWGDFSLPTTGIKAGLRNPDNVNLYYVDEDGLILRLDAGLNTLPNGNTYYAAKDGCYIPLYDRGVHDLGGKLYYVQKNGSILTDRYMDGYITPVYEYDGNMYYIKEDYSLARSEYVGYLYFGSNGAYTTGDAELDTLVYDFCKSVIQDANQTQVEKLRSMYVYVRDAKTSSGSSFFTYKNYMLDPTVDDWSETACAKRMLQSHKGECFHWSSMMVMIMCRLGFDAYKQNGAVISSSGSRATHAWEVINWPDGNKYMFDVQLEWGWLYGYYASGRVFNLYKMSHSARQSIGTYDW